MEGSILKQELETKGAACDYVRLASLYWKEDIMPLNETLQMILSDSKVYCYCNNCNGTATRLAGWVCVELMPVDKLLGQTMFLEANHSLITQLYDDVSFPLSPSSKLVSTLNPTPLPSAIGWERWICPDLNLYSVTVALELHEQTVGHMLISICINLKAIT